MDVGGNIGLFCVLMLRGPLCCPGKGQAGEAQSVKAGSRLGPATAGEGGGHPAGGTGRATGSEKGCSGFASPAAPCNTCARPGWRGPPSRIVVLEPLPPVCRALKHNVGLLEALGLAQQDQVGRVILGTVSQKARAACIFSAPLTAPTGTGEAWAALRPPLGSKV